LGFWGLESKFHFELVEGKGLEEKIGLHGRHEGKGDILLSQVENEAILAHLLCFKGIIK